MFLKVLQDFITIHDRHLNIQQHQLRMMFIDHGQGLPTIGGLNAMVTILFNQLL